jgi:hypothetical protein
VRATRFRQPHIRPSFLTVSSFFVFTPPFTAGDIGTLVLPEGMQYLDLSDCTGLTGKAKGEVKK